MKITKLIIPFLVLSSVFIACSNGSESSSFNMEQASAGEDLDMMEAKTANSGDNLLAYNDMSSENQGEESVKKKIIRTARLNIEVSNFHKAKEMFLDIANKNSAEIEKEEEQNYDYRLQTNLVIRLAPEKLDDFLVALETLGTQVHFKSIEAKDVTKQFIDLESRLENKKAVVKRYRELLAEASNVTEVLAVEEKLRLVVEEIESTQKSLQYLQGQVQRSVIYFEMFQRINNSTGQPSFWNQVGNAFGDGWYGFKQFLVGLFTLWPFLILFGGVWYLIAWYRRRRKG